MSHSATGWRLRRRFGVLSPSENVTASTRMQDGRFEKIPHLHNVEVGALSGRLSSRREIPVAAFPLCIQSASCRGRDEQPCYITRCGWPIARVISLKAGGVNGGLVEELCYRRRVFRGSCWARKDAEWHYRPAPDAVCLYHIDKIVSIIDCVRASATSIPSGQTLQSHPAVHELGMAICSISCATRRASSGDSSRNHVLVSRPTWPNTEGVR